MTNVPSDTFCILPFIHFYQSPNGAVSGCCVSSGSSNIITTGSIESKINSSMMMELRKSMLDGKQHPSCEICWKQEEINSHESTRIGWNNLYIDEYPDQIDDAIKSTDRETGYIHDFKLRYVDARYSNVCNYKCRSCSAGFSSSWQAENIKHNTPDWIGGGIVKIIDADTNLQTITEIIDQIPNINEIYFAGGEPLVEENTYILINECIKNNRTDIALRFSTNGSVTSFKNYDLISMLLKFDNVNFVVSIDSHEERAEYMRHGTKWETLLSNLHQFEKTGVNITYSATIGVLNYLTFPDTIEYLTKQKLLGNKELGINILTQPNVLSAQILPVDLKQIAEIKWKRISADLPEHTQDCITDLINYVNLNNTYDTQIESFRKHTNWLDQIRNESFNAVFPELEALNV